VEDEQCAVLIAELAEAFEESRRGRDHTHVAGDGFDDDRRDFLALGLEERGDGVEVVVAGKEGFAGGGFGDAWGGWRAEGDGVAARGDEEAVGVSVVAAFELDDAGAAGGSAGEAHGAHRRLGAAADEADHFDRLWEGGDDFFGKLDLGAAGGAETEAIAGGG